MPRPRPATLPWPAPLAPLLLALTAGACASLIGLDDYERVDGPAPAPGTGGSGGAGESCSPGTSEACYSGPAETEGRGICLGGTRTCSDAGAWGACEGEVLPAAEVCATAVDDDCDGQVNEEGADCSCEAGAVAACYTGPAETRGVGLCSDGQQVCNDSGQGYGPCTGDTLPATEVCGTDVDEDCDGEGWFPDTDCVCEPGSTGPCYTGPMGTQGVGTCQGGMWTCNADGLGWDGNCVGEVSPATENCGTPEDEDCDNGGGWYDAGETIECVCQPGSDDTCYTGSPGTENVGICQPGTWTCNANGLTYGACTGDVTPTTEICGNGLDEQCDGVPCAEVLWALAAPGMGTQVVHDVAVDTAGNIIVVGTFTNSITIGNSTFIADGIDSFVFKLSPQGAVLWAERFGPAQDQTVRSVATDGLDNIYLTGYFNTSIDIDGANISAGMADDVDFFVAKLDPQGSRLWAHGYGSDGNTVNNEQQALGIDVNSAGDVAVTGWFNGSVTLGNTISGSGGQDIFVARLSANGIAQSIVGFGDGSEQTGRSLALGNGVYVVGDGAGTFSVAGTQLSNGITHDAIAIRLDPPSPGTPWSDNFGGASSNSTRGLDIALDPSGNVLLAGHYNGPLDFGGGTLPQAGPSRFVAKLSPGGSWIWSDGFAAGLSVPSSSQVTLGVAADSAGNVLLTGDFTGTTNFGGGSLTANGTDLFIAKFSASGSHIWSRRFGNSQAQFGVAVATDPNDDHIVIAGHFLGQIDFGVPTVAANGAGNSLQTLFVAKLTP